MISNFKKHEKQYLYIVLFHKKKLLTGLFHSYFKKPTCCCYFLRKSHLHLRHLNFLLTLSIKSANLYSLGSLTQRNGALYLIASSLWIAVFRGNVDNSWRFGIRYSLFWNSNREFMRSYEMTLIIAKLDTNNHITHALLKKSITFAFYWLSLTKNPHQRILVAIELYYCFMSKFSFLQKTDDFYRASCKADWFFQTALCRPL